MSRTSPREPAAPSMGSRTRSDGSISHALSPSLTSLALSCSSRRSEDNLDRAFRQRYPDYSQPASSQLNRDIQTTAHLMLQAHETGRSNDTSLSVQMNQTQFLELMRLLGLSRRELNELLPRTGKDKGRFTDPFSHTHDPQPFPTTPASSRRFSSRSLSSSRREIKLWRRSALPSRRSPRCATACSSE
jgi:hypothetical protein